MTLMHSGQIRGGLWQVIKCLHTNMTKECFYDTFSDETLCSQIERESYQLCQTKNCAICFQDLWHLCIQV